jgi:hypothetical protein
VVKQLQVKAKNHHLSITEPLPGVLTISTETYNARVTEKGEIMSLFFTIENNKTDAKDTQNELMLMLHIDCRTHILPECIPNGRERFHALHWFPPDVDVLAAPNVDPRSIPQRTRPWHLIRPTADLSGSSSPKFLGYFVPSRKEKPTWSIKNAAGAGAITTFTIEEKCRMRLGTIMEESALIIYMHMNPHVIFHEVGWCSAAVVNEPKWGASPDGFLVRPNMTWDLISPDIRSHYEGNPKINIQHGVLEIKTSQYKTSMEPYYIPQMYLEMMVLGAVWGDLIRYRPMRSKSADGKWTIHDQACIYRVERHLPTEEMMITLWKYAYTNSDRLQDIVNESEFVQMRIFLKNVAEHLVPWCEFRADTDNSGVSAALTYYLEQKQQHFTPIKQERGGTELMIDAEEENGDDSVMKKLLKRTRETAEELCLDTSDEMTKVRLLARQMRDYGAILARLKLNGHNNE